MKYALATSRYIVTSILALLLVLLIFALKSWTVGPKYVRPSAPTPTAYKEQPSASYRGADQWQPANAGDQASRGNWWEMQSSDRLPVTDAEKIADALRAGPAFITKNATLLDWPSASGGEYRLLRKGSNEWTCLPAIPGYPHDAIDSAFKEEPGCYDPIFLRAMQDSIAGRTPHIDRIGISYMYLGAWKSAKDGSSGHEFHVGPHLMVVVPHQDEFQGFNRDATNGMPYVTHLPNRTELFLVMPVRQWDE